MQGNIIQHRNTIILCVLGLLLAVATYYLGQHRLTLQHITEQEQAQRMQMPDTLRVVTLSGASTYFTIQDEEMGYQYELLKLYSDSIGIPFTLTVSPSLDSLHSLLSRGEAHLSITPEAVMREGQSPWVFTGPTVERSMVLVQRKKQGQGDSTYLHNVTELIDKPLYVLSDSHYEQRMKHLGEQLGANLDIRYIEGDTTNAEDLIAEVATDSIDYAIVDSELAQMASPYYRNIDYKLRVGFPQRLRWLTTERYQGLAESLDAWAEEAPNLSKAKHIYKKYFDAYRIPLVDADSRPAEATDYKVLRPGVISPYDDLFKSAASGLPWSWHLLAAIAYQESRFDASVIGWSGARGLMGIMPATGRAYGTSKEELLNPQNAIQVSIKCLLNTEKAFRAVSDPEERLRFTLGGYNAGVGHIQDAQRLAKKYGADPNVWTGQVERFVLLKSERKYYSDPVCRHGYLRGKETHSYAQEVYKRYKAYQKL